MKKFYIFCIALMILTTSLTAAPNELSESNNKFAFKLFDEIISDNENTFFAPYSITAVIAMLHSGSENSTRDAIADAMFFEMKKPYKSYKELSFKLTDNNSDKFRISTANSIWLDKFIIPRWGFRRVMKKYYMSEIKFTDFKRKHETARLDINKWVEEKTMNKIKNLLPENAVSPATRFVLTNAVYFKGQWQKQFDKAGTKKKEFRTYSESRDKALVDLMSNEAKYNYYENKVVQIASVPYIDGKSSMIIFLPIDKNDGSLRTINELLKEESIESLYALKEKMRPRKIRLQIPRFSSTLDYSLENHLSKIGLSNIFSSDADFSKITKKEKLVIDDIIHKAFIDVNEEGTEAAAATGAVARTTSMPRLFTADKPFIYMIVNNETDTILFMGTFVKP